MEVIVLSAFYLFLALREMLSMWGVKVICGSKVILRMVGFLFIGILWLKRCTVGFLFDSRLSGVRRVIEDFCGETVIRFSVSHCSRDLMYICMFLAAVVYLWC